MKVTMLLEALTPVAHGDTSTGIDNVTNQRLFMRQLRIINGTAVQVPGFSENAFRSSVIRRNAADSMLTTLGVEKGSLRQSVVNLLYSGGSRKPKIATPAKAIEYGHGVKTLYPMLDLLGGSVDGFILPRSRLKVTCTLVAREFAPTVNSLSKPLDADATEAVQKALRETSCFDLLGAETRTRGTGDESDGNQMLYGYEVLSAGALMLVEFALDRFTPPATLACLLDAVQNWDLFIGGQGRQGRGRVGVVSSSHPISDDVTGQYTEHLSAYGGAMKSGLLDGTLGQGEELLSKGGGEQ